MRFESTVGSVCKTSRARRTATTSLTVNDRACASSPPSVDGDETTECDGAVIVSATTLCAASLSEQLVAVAARAVHEDDRGPAARAGRQEQIALDRPSVALEGDVVN